MASVIKSLFNLLSKSRSLHKKNNQLLSFRSINPKLFFSSRIKFQERSFLFNLLILTWQGFKNRGSSINWKDFNKFEIWRRPLLSFNRIPLSIRNPVTLTYLLPLTFPLKFILTPVTCQDKNCQPTNIITNASVPTPSSTSLCNKENKPSVVTAGNTDNAKSNAPPKTMNGQTPIKWSVPDDFSHKTLIRQACQISVDSVTRILTQSVSAYQDYNEEYRRLLDCLLDALEDSRTSQGTSLELIDCKLVMLRSRVEEMKFSILELESFLCSVQKLAEAAAETSFLGHAEYASVAMSERVQSVALEMKAIKELTTLKERDMIELQSLVIVESGKGLK